jgi:CubicO group peptidase (beta-lactamase class C family)
MAQRIRKERFLSHYRQLAIACCLLLLSLVNSNCNTLSSAQKTAMSAQEGRTARFERELEELRIKLRIPGMSAAIVKDQKILWTKGFGFADPENRVPATPETNYRIASLTKTFASTLLMQLVERGKLDLDEPMSKFSPEFQKRFNNNAIKVRHVLTHTSHDNPGENYRYDGNRFSYLTDVIEKASGSSFRELLIKEILDKIQMTTTVPGQDILDDRSKWSTFIDAEHIKRYEDGLAKLSKPYRLYGTEIIQTIYPPRRINTSAGLVSNVLDLAKYDIAVDHHTFIKAETQDRAWTPAVSTNGRTLPYGFGWFVQKYQDIDLIWHYGYWPDSFSSLSIKVPGRRITFILLANSDALSSSFRGLGNGNVMASSFAASFLRVFIFEQLLGRTLPDPRWSLSTEQFKAEIERLAKQTDGYRYEAEQASHNSLSRWLEDRKNSARKEVRVDPKIFDSYTGRYEIDSQEAVIISREGDKLFFQLPDQSRSELFPQSDTTFFLKTRDILITFVKDEKGQVTGMEAEVRGQRRRARKVR